MKANWYPISDWRSVVLSSDRFPTLARSVRAAGAAAGGSVEQGAFLRALGIGERAAVLKRRATEAQAADIDSAVALLTGADGMGTLFKVLAFAHPALGAPAGFA